MFIASRIEASGEEHLHLIGERRLIIRADAVSYSGEWRGTVLLVRDHTELHQTITELEGAQSTTELLRGQTHEFQNNLHVIGGLLELGDDRDQGQSIILRQNPHKIVEFRGGMTFTHHE